MKVSFPFHPASPNYRSSSDASMIACAMLCGGVAMWKACVPMVSEDSTSRVMVLPVRVFTKILSAS